ncbi:MAG: family 43 glycosylhydrolase [Oscillospiraceae bacterium]|nr:family 43 glycosylhydrolase [Oscillospiraceae bacterium]
MKKRIICLMTIATMLSTLLATGCGATGTASDFTISDELTDTQELGYSVGDTLSDPDKLVGENNPISSVTFFADPTSVEYEGRLYVYGTNDNEQYDAGTGNDENTYGSIGSLVCYSTDDMVNWTYECTIEVTEIATWAGCSWAPSIVSRETSSGKTEFYLYFANASSGIGVLKSDSPTGPWEDPIGAALIDNSTGALADDPVYWCFDPGVVIDENGVGWLAFGGGSAVHDDEDGMYTGNCRIVKLGDDMISLDSEIVKVPAVYHFEANELNYINGTYVLTYCSNYEDRYKWSSYGSDEEAPTTCSMVYMTSTDPLNPDSWVYGGEYLSNPSNYGFSFSNNHSHLQKFGDNYYILYQTVMLLDNMGSSVSGYRSIGVDLIEVDEETVTISPATMTCEGVEQLKDLDAFEVNQAETAVTTAGVSYYTSEGRTFVTSISDGDWSAVSSVDFGNGANAFAATVRGKGIIEVRLDSADGNVVGSVQFETGSDFKTIVCTLDKTISGTHDLYFVFGGSFVFDEWQFAYISDETVSGLSVSTNNGKVKLSWNSSTDSEYTVYYRRSSSSEWNVAGSTKKSAVNISGLTSGITYQFVVKNSTSSTDIVTTTLS